MKQVFLFLILFLALPLVVAAQYTVRGTVTDSGTPVPYAVVSVPGSPVGTATDSLGAFELRGLTSSKVKLQVSLVGYHTENRTIALSDGDNVVDFQLRADPRTIDEVVVTGTMKEMSRKDSPIPVEIVTAKFFQKNPTPSLFESIGMLNGIKPQLNCNICNTGDIHINGMEGPYTMILIDGMPIVSSLSSVYGLSGIPNSIVNRIEVVKGPASSLYGSEAMGGIINVITKNPGKAPRMSIDAFGSSWQEYNVDVAFKSNIGKANQLLGVNYFNYQQPADRNNDGFTDVTLQHRISVFNKWSLERRANRLASMAARYVYEDRWGGQMNWSKEWRGSDSIYGESIYTRRVELTGIYQLPLREKVMTQFSYNWHDQNSWYGTTPYMASQQVAFAQAYWDKQLGERHSLLLGSALRWNYYDDNTPATSTADGGNNQPAITTLPGVFIQDEWTLNSKHKILAGYRFDYDKNHGPVHSPRVAYKWAPDADNTLRASFGTGFRVVNLFTEDHAALTGAREVVIADALLPERSYNGNLNYVLRKAGEHFFANLDVTGFYSYFTNKIVGDFVSHPDKIIYENLEGYAVSRGVSVNLDFNFTNGLKLLAGATFMDVFQAEKDEDGALQKNRQMFAPEWSGNLVASYAFRKGWTVDLTANWYGPMRLPILPNDFRPEYSPLHCLANVQVTKKISPSLEVYGGVKNLLNFVPKHPKMRASDPFDKEVNDPVGNPYGYTFDPSYNYAPLQGVRGFGGLRWMLR